MHFREGKNCYRLASSQRIAFLVDGEDYYRAVADACESARQAIYILGWDVDSRTRLRRGKKDVPETLGQFVERLVREHPELHIYILEWDFAMFYSLERETLSWLSLGWMSHERVHFEFDDNHPVGACHHQKIVVIDDLVAFVGGFDLASFRWDTSEHLPNHPERTEQGASYGPVHDVQMLVDGETAKELGRIARHRWDRATGVRLAEPAEQKHDPWPEDISPDHREVRLAILRTEPKHDGRAEVREIEAFYLDAIARAESFIYMENQYLSSHAICEALEKSLRQTEGPEILLVLPRKCPGWLEEETMGALRQGIQKRLLAADRNGRLRVCYPERAGLTTDVIIVHSKLLIVDDTLLTIGSANLSNRSMGFDTECNLALAADGQKAIAETIARFRNRLLAEHLGTERKVVADHLARNGSLLATIQNLGNERRSLKILPTSDDEALLENLRADVMFDPERPGSVDQLFDLFGTGTSQQSDAKAGDIRSKAWRFFAFITSAILLAILWRWSPLKDWLSLDNLLAAADAVRESSMTIPIVLAIYVVGSCLMFPINLLILATALSFGSITGFGLAISGSILGGLASYLMGHWLGRDVVSKLGGERVNRLSRKLARRGWLAVALVRVVPIAPFTIVNMVAGASHISARSFLIGTTIGMCPGILAIMVFEEGLERALRNPHGGTVALAIIALCAAALILWGGKRWLARKNEGQDG
ncbi:phospholipase [Desulfuromonas sp. DDH964]|uniref:VTT domain-containing protein n=1 Tax=Desulfuromonas sp. DDH964 TaxID=1823759 RepID=UPI00078E796E|nr:VTT domain-containing protein [Desulfuromonas sp. DDH964]AMV72328.1 phospholipase [Desulfuromonas sp. DDH964]